MFSLRNKEHHSVEKSTLCGAMGTKTKTDHSICEKRSLS